MDDWRTTTLGQLVSFQRGHDLPTDRREVGPIPVMGSFGITGWHSTARAKGPGVTVGRSGASIGVVSYIDRDYWPLNTCLFSTDLHGNNPRFVFYFLKTVDLAAHNSGSAQPSLNRNYIAPIQIRVPVRHEQDRIADLLGSLDDKIDLNRRMNETLEAMAQAIFRDWFVDFGPTRRKMAGATDPVEIMGGIVTDADRARQMSNLFPAAIDNGLPGGWEIRTVSAVTALVKRGLTPTYANEGLVVVNQRCIRDRRLDYAPARRHDASRRAPKERELQDHDVLVNSTGVGTLGRVATVRHLPEPATADSHVTICRPDPASISKVVFSLFMEGEEEKIAGMGHGSTGQTELNPASLGSMQLVLAPGQVQREFDAIAIPLREQSAANQLQNRTLAATRDLLLPKLMSGEIRLRDAEAASEAAA